MIATETPTVGYDREADEMLDLVVKAEILADMDVDAYPVESFLTDTLVRIYKVLNPVHNNAKKLRDAVRKELEARRETFGTENEKGVFRIDSSHGAVEFRPRIKTVFNEEAALEILKKHDLLEYAVDEETVITDPEKLMKTFEQVQEFLVQIGQHQMAQEMEQAYHAATERRLTPNEGKIEKLVKKNRLPLSEVEGMYQVSTSYALYDVKG